MKILFLIGLLCFFPSQTFAEESVTSTDSSGFFSLFEKVNQEKTTLSEKESNIGYAKEKIEENTKIINDIEEIFGKLINVSSDIIFFQSTFSGAIETIDDSVYLEKTKIFTESYAELHTFLSGSQDEVKTVLPEMFPEIQSGLKKSVSSKTLELRDEIIKFTQELTVSEEAYKLQLEEISKSELALQIQTQDMIKKLIFFIVSLTFIILIRKYLKKFIKGREKFSEEKKDIFFLVLRWVTNTLIAIIVFGFFFSEFVSILPFLAILGTALGFALRDIISSFIAWFIIGLKDAVYKVGDVIDIEADKVSGRVIKVSPLVTVIQELGMSGPNGTYTSFPNKRIFETPIKNFSKMNNWIYISFDFILDIHSSFKTAKILLMEVMVEITTKDQFKSAQSQKNFLKKFGHAEASIMPQVFIESKPQGILLRGKVMAHWSERHEIRSQIVETFMERGVQNVDIKIKDIVNI